MAYLNNLAQMFPNVLSEDLQRTKEWFEQRRGKVTASEVHKVLTSGKGGAPSKTRRNYAIKLASERLSGVPSDSIDTKAMQWGREQEEHALREFEKRYGKVVVPVSFIDDPNGKMLGVSPDGLVDNNATVEVKCKNSENHLEIILSGALPKEHKDQVQMQLMVTEREFCYFISYDPRYKDEHLRLFVVQVPRDEDYIATLRQEIDIFLEEVEAIVNSLSNKTVN